MPLAQATRRASSIRLEPPMPTRQVGFSWDAEPDDASLHRTFSASAGGRDDAAHHWSLADDASIVRARCFKPQVSWAMLVHKFHERYDEGPKGGLSVAVLKARLAELVDETQERFALLVRDVLDEPNSEVKLLPEYEQQELSLGILEGVVESHALRTGDAVSGKAILQVQYNGRNFEGGAVKVEREALVQVSEMVRAAVSDTSSTIEAAEDLKKVGITFFPRRAMLVFSDAGAPYDGVQTFDHFAGELCERLVLFSADPDMVERKAEAEERLRSIQSSNAATFEAVVDALQGECERSLEELQRLQNDEVGKVTHLLESAMERDIRVIKETHERTLEVERQKLATKFNLRRRKLSSFYESEKTQAIDMLHRVFRGHLVQLEQINRILDSQVASVFGDKSLLVRLLLLAEDVRAPKLRKSLIRVISQPDVVLDCVSRPEMRSQLLPASTIQSILTRVRLRELTEIISLGRRFREAHMAKRELQSRQLAAKGHLRAISSQLLRRIIPMSKEVSAGEELVKLKEDTEEEALMRMCASFPDLVEAEAQLRGQRHAVKIDSSRLPPFCSCIGGAMVQLRHAHRYVTAFADHHREAGQFGKWQFEVTIDACDSNGGSISVGWDVPHVATGRELVGHSMPGLTAHTPEQLYGISWQSDGKGAQGVGYLHTAGEATAGLPSFATGDVITCLLDQDDADARVYFHRNGRQEFPILAGGKNARGGPVIRRESVSDLQRLILEAPDGFLVPQPEAYKLVPSVCLYVAQREQMAQVRFNFTGPFKFPVEGFAAYGTEDGEAFLAGEEDEAVTMANIASRFEDEIASAGFS